MPLQVLTANHHKLVLGHGDLSWLGCPNEPDLQISFFIFFLPTEVAPIFSNLLHVFWNGQGLADNISNSHFLGAVSSGDWAVLRQVETSVPTPSEIYGTPNFWRIRCKSKKNLLAKTV